ncbi:MAG TPA: SCO family protein, partial [Candidatus Limnocylindrales bacterium]|nr:SCO family protein [Candidatus Limnocylindrales bacterium]
ALSIDPKRDTPEVLKAYAEKFHVAPPAWTFLTGKKEDVDLVAKKMGLFFDPALNRDGHSVDLMMGNESTGQWMKTAAIDNARFLATKISGFLGHPYSSKPGPDYAQAKPLVMTDQGHHLYTTQCAACHTIGHGDTIGPDLLGITKVRNRDWLARIIQTPDVMLKEGDPLATALFKKYKQIRMPNLQVDAEGAMLLINFIERQSEREESKAAPAQAPAADQPASQPAKGGVSLHHN